MDLESAIELYDKLEADTSAQNFYARANARYILFSVSEPRRKHPRTLDNNLNFGSDTLAFSYLSIGCCLFENQIRDDRVIQSLEKGAEFIEYNHLPKQNRNELSSYYLLISGLAYYAARHYSKAFILLKHSEEYDMPIGHMASLFLKKEYIILRGVLNDILLHVNYIGQTINNENNVNIDANIHVVLFAKAVANVLEYLQTGNIYYIDAAEEIFNDLEDLLMIDKEPSAWWVVRLFMIIVSGFRQSSLWATIPPKLQDGNPQIIHRFITGLIFRPKPIVELFSSQELALSKVLNNEGAVVSLPTSSGKTRIAEIAILECLSKNTEAKVLYLAPFRSLAFEVEYSLESTFTRCGIGVSYLYGGNSLTALDRNLVNEAQILIATPEKAKAILRAKEELLAQIQLVIIDEGHLLGEEPRYVLSELFIEELRYHIHKRGGKIILLSAVLPNTEDISKWIAQNENQVVKSDWRPSRQQMGILKYRNGNTMRIDWLNTEGSFNEKFIEPFDVSEEPLQLSMWGSNNANKRIFPNNKREAIISTALKLSKIGSVLIYESKQTHIKGYFEPILTALKKIDNRLVVS